MPPLAPAPFPEMDWLASYIVTTLRYYHVPLFVCFLPYFELSALSFPIFSRFNWQHTEISGACWENNHNNHDPSTCSSCPLPSSYQFYLIPLFCCICLPTRKSSLKAETVCLPSLYPLTPDKVPHIETRLSG